MTLAYLQIRRIDYSCVATSAGIAMRLSEQAKWMVRNVYQANPSIRTAYPELFAVIGAKVPDYRGLFLRGYGQQTYTQNNGSMVGNTATTHASGELGKVQGDAIRDPGEAGKSVLRGPVGGYDHEAYSIKCEGAICDGEDFSMTRQDQWATQRVVSNPVINILKGLQQPFGNEIRPVNTAVRYFIRARP